MAYQDNDRRRNRQQGDIEPSRQSEQFESGRTYQSGDHDQRDYDEGRYDRRQMGDEARARGPAYAVGYVARETRYVRPSEERRMRAEQRRRDAYRRDEDDGGYGEDYGPSRYDNREGRGFQSFTSEDQGGADFVSGSSRPYGGYGAGMGGRSAAYATGDYSSAPRRGYSDRYEDRGFLDRAGDEIASWFGDEDAARRREMDHSGRGPSNYTRSDDRILEDTCDNLTDDYGVDARNIQVTVSGGEVTLDGTVPSRGQKRRAEDCVDCISGVGHVQNNLRVQDSRTETANTETT